MTKPLFMQRTELVHKAVIIHCLNKHGKPIDNAYASGFILREEDGLYLYTCWHVVSGIKDMYNLKSSGYKFERTALRVSLQKSDEQQTGSKLRAFVINGLNEFDVPLYELTTEDSYKPLWRQEPTSTRLIYLETNDSEYVVDNVTFPSFGVNFIALEIRF